MVKLNRVLGGAVLACTLLVGPIARADEEKPVHLIVKPVVGHVVRTKSIVKIDLMGMEMEAQGVEKSTVTAVQENGDVISEIVDEGGKIRSAGAEQDLPITPTYSITHDKFGKTIKSGKKPSEDGFTTPEVNKLMDALTDVVLTDKALKPNDTWQHELENPVIKEKKIVVKDTYLGLEKIAGKSYWKVKESAEAIVDADGAKVTYQVTEWIDPANGDTFQLEGSVSNVPTKAGLMTMHVNAKTIEATNKSK